MDYREITHQHQALRRTIVRLRDLTTAPRRCPRSLLVSEIRSLRTELRDHFEREEEGGYLDVVLAERPGWSRRVEKLRLQHVQILTELEHLTDIDDEQLGTSLGEVLDLVRRHDVAESSMLQEAVVVDLGDAD